MNCLGCVVERDARPPIRMAKKQETEQSARPPVFFIFLLLKVFLLFYSFTFLLLKVLFTFLLFYFFTFKSLFTFLLFYFFTFKSFSSPAIDIIKRLAAGSNFIYSKIIKSPIVFVHYTCTAHADIIHLDNIYRWCYIFFLHISSLLLYFFSVHNIYSLRQTFKR